ncbi:MAG: hypothetical protein JWN30_965, partial [Bacilli bacterium]|nr:hypothetical protein [Bacilli bacterium]
MWQAPKRLAGSTLRDGVLSLLLWIWLTLLLLPLCAAAKLSQPDLFVYAAGLLFAVAWLIPFRILQAAAALLIIAYTEHRVFFAHEPFWSQAWLTSFLRLLQSGRLAVVNGGLQDAPTVTMGVLLVLWGAVYLYRQVALDRIVLFALWAVGLLAIGIEDSFTPADGHLYMIGYFVMGLLVLALCQVPYLEKTVRLGHRRVGWPLPFVIGTVAVAICTAAVGIAAPKLRSQWPDPVPYLKNYATTGGAGSLQLKKSGYTSDDTLLGGSFTADNGLAMVAISDQAGYWRGETRTLYTGKGWMVSPDALPSPANVNGETSLNGFSQFNVLAGVANPQVQVTKVVQSVSIVAGNPSVFFSQYELAGLTLTGDTAGSTLSDHQVFWSKRSDYVRSDIVKSGSTYTVISDVPTIDQSKFNELYTVDPHYDASVLQNVAAMSSAFTTPITLGASRAGVSDPFLLTFSSELQIPDSFPQRDRDLAIKIVAGQSTDYDKAKAIENYLRKNYVYETKQVPTPGPQDDFVDQFLFASKKGYCDHFSSAMVMLARSSGLPARWVTGYTTGTVDSAYQDPTETHQMRFLIHNSDAHAWAEVYLRGVGWIPFEPTPSFTLPQPQ